MLDCAEKLPESVEANKFKKLFVKRVKEKIFGEVLTVTDYLCVMMIPDPFYQTLSMLSVNEAKSMKKDIYKKIGQLLRHDDDSDSEDETTTEKSATDLFFSDLHKKNRSNEEETYLRTYIKDKSVDQDLTKLTCIERSEFVKNYWACYSQRHGDIDFVQVVQEQLVGYVGTSESERGFSGNKAQTGTVYSEKTTSMKSCLKSGRKSGLYQLLMESNS